MQRVPLERNFRHIYGIPALFLLAAVVHGLVTVYIFSVVPEFPLRALAWLGWRRRDDP